MKQWFGAAALLALAAGCGSSADDLVKESLKCWEEAAEVLAGITDAESGKYADAKLQDIVRRMSDLNQQAKRHRLAPDEVMKLEMDNASASSEVLRRVRDASKKAMEIPGCAELVLRFNRQARGIQSGL